jgi:uncharacterized protein (DUF1015 family)
VPQVRPFRALRYEPEIVGDLAAVVSPPYDVISPTEAVALLARHPKNVVRLDLPVGEQGDGPDDRYRRAARTFAAWRSDGTFHKDPRPSLYVYEQDYRVPGSAIERVQRGFFGRLRLEPFEPGSGVLPHERTMSAPREDRYKLLRATGVNTSPVVGLYEDPAGQSARILEDVARTNPIADVIDDDRVRHRMWALPAEGSEAGQVATLIAAAASGPITIADGHHRYETALRYRDERRMSRSCEEDPAFDYILMLFLEATSPLTVLPTHRVLGGLGEDGVEVLRRGLSDLFDEEPVDGAARLIADFGANGSAHSGRGRFGLWTRSGAAILTARWAAFEPLVPAGGQALRHLDVTLLQVVLEQLAGIDQAGVAAGRVVYTKSAEEAIAWVNGTSDGADVAFLLEPTPVAAIVEVAREGDVMPQKSTYFYPKPLTGLVINPHEW